MAKEWKLYVTGKMALGDAALNLGTGPIYLCLHTSAASANVLQLAGSITTWGSIGNEISAYGQYVAGGKTLPNFDWTTGASAKQCKFTWTATGLVITASASAFASIKYAVLRNSTGAGAGKPICFATLTTSGVITIAKGNSITIKPASQGAFTLS